jgi:hypothetical protein
MTIPPSPPRADPLASTSDPAAEAERQRVMALGDDWLASVDALVDRIERTGLLMVLEAAAHGN